ncbi:Cytohesin-3 [Pitangus sulphuratus]|nr:Cytohesin-3 [Pitangus sulphuratus]
MRGAGGWAEAAAAAGTEAGLGGEGRGRAARRRSETEEEEKRKQAKEKEEEKEEEEEEREWPRGAERAERAPGLADRRRSALPAVPTWTKRAAEAAAAARDPVQLGLIQDPAGTSFIVVQMSGDGQIGVIVWKFSKGKGIIAQEGNICGRCLVLYKGAGEKALAKGVSCWGTSGDSRKAKVPDDLSIEEREELLNIRRRKKELIDDIERLKFEIAEVMTEIDNLTSVEESKTTQRNKQIAMGRKKFNMDPKKGIQFLIENDLLQNTAEDIAQFLYKGEGLNKTVIGDYLGERDEFNIKVLQAFVELHEFADLNLVQALRQFLWSFRLPGEAQKIDRMMEAFASRYCLCNPGVFQSTDTCYVLSFAIIMLNTSLHNHNVRDKPTVERFISMNRGINEGGDLPEELLRNLYESIKNEPFKIPEDDGNDLTHTFFNPDREGWLLKLGGRVKTWKRRWFILTDNCLYYFEYTTDKEPRGIIPLENLSIREVEDPRKPNCFELYNPSHKGQVIKACKTEADGRVVEGNHVVYRISAPTPEEKEEWIKSIKASISRDPFYDMLATRKRRIANKK